MPLAGGKPAAGAPFRGFRSVFPTRDKALKPNVLQRACLHFPIFLQSPAANNSAVLPNQPPGSSVTKITVLRPLPRAALLRSLLVQPRELDSRESWSFGRMLHPGSIPAAAK